MADKTDDTGPTSTIRKMLFFEKFFDDDKWKVFWLHYEDILGVIYCDKQFYEKEMTKDERKQLLGNIGGSLLDGKWMKAFDERNFKLKLLGDAVEVSCGSNKTSLNQNNIEDKKIPKSLSKFITYLMEESSKKKSTQRESKERAQDVERVPAKRNLCSPESEIPAKSRRPRKSAIGLQFED